MTTTKQNGNSTKNNSPKGSQNRAVKSVKNISAQKEGNAQENTPIKKSQLAGVLIRFYAGSLPSRRSDKNESKDLESAKSAKNGTLNVSKKLFSGDELKKEADARIIEARAFFKKLPIYGDSEAICRADYLQEFCTNLNAKIQAAKDAVKLFADSLEMAIEKDKTELGQMFKESDYGLCQKVKAWQSFIEIRPLPDSFASGLVSEAVEREASLFLAKRLQEAKGELLNRLREKLNHAANAIPRAHETRFCASSLSNVAEIAREVSQVLFDDDSEIKSLCAEIEKTFVELTANTEGIKSEFISTVRDDAEAKAKAQLEKVNAAMSAFM